jgi:radical SAM superfamily enzyme YgiQ (UPF0313 family)
MNVTFVSTRKNEDRTERELYEMDLLIQVLGFKRSFLDLGIETVAACTPREVTFRIVDEYLEDIDYGLKTDLVALSAKTSCATRTYEIARRFRERGTKVVLGGIHASLRPDEALEHVDCVVTGEAELAWPRAVRDLARGKLARRYDADGFPPMTDVPVPAWSQSRADQYLFHQLQTTRGCPFKCRFCSVPDISGQEFRAKAIEQVVRELVALPRSRGPIASGKPLYVVDDNFISRTRYTKELLRAMVPLRERGLLPGWSAETTLNVAADDELLDLFRAAGCATLIIGFESVTEATLNDMDKPVNFCLTYQEAVDRIHARGMTVVGNFIVGFDTDTVAVFKQTRDFVQKTGILYPFFSILTPMPGTKLFDDMRAEGRLEHETWGLYDTRHVVFEPKQMTKDELMDGYVWLFEQCYGTDLLWERVEGEWRRRSRDGALPEKLFVGARLAPHLARGDAELRRHFGAGLKLMMRRGLKTDPGQLLYVLDSYDFARSMRRWNSPRRAENYATFERPERALADARREPGVLQWENKKALARTKRALPVVASR